MDRRILLAALTWLAACGDDASAPDTGISADSGVDGTVLVPTAPELPGEASRDCPPGWARTVGSSGGACAPWMDAPSCSVGEYRFVGDPDCGPVGSTCPAGEFPTDLPVGTVYVREGGDGDGSAGAPLGDLAAAVAVAGADGTVALGPGTHEGGVFLPAGLTLRGTCASRTTITSTVEPSSSEPAVIMGGGAGTTLRDLTIRSPIRAGIVVLGAGNEIHADGVVVEDSYIGGVIASTGALFVGRDVVVRGTRPRDDGMGGSGVSAESGGSVELHRAIVADNELQGIAVATTRGTLVLEDVHVHETRSQRSDGDLGRGVTAVGGAAATLTRVVIEDSQDGGLFIDGDGTTLTGIDLVVRRTRPRTVDDAFGRGVSVVSGATATISGLLVEDSVEAGVFVGLGASLSLDDGLVRRTRSAVNTGEDGFGVLVQAAGQLALTRVTVDESQSTGVFAVGTGTIANLSDVSVTTVTADDLGADGHGIVVSEGATLDGSRVSIERATATGLFVTDTSSTAALSDATIRQTRPRADGGGGRGINVQDGSRLSLTRAAIEENIETGVFVDAADAALSDVRISGTATRADGYGGRAINAQLGATVAVTRVLVEDSRDSAVAILNGATLTGEDLTVTGTRESAAPGGDGRGITIQLAELRVMRARISDNRGVGVFLFGTSTFEASGLTVEGTRAADCGITTCLEDSIGHGHGVGVYGESSATLNDFTIIGSEVCGIHVGFGAQADLVDGEVSDNAIGACIENADLDLSRIMEGVFYRDNVTNLESTRLPVPMASPDL